MQKARAACATLVACGLVVGTSSTAWAAGETVESTVSIKKASKIKKKKPGQAKVSWQMNISKPDGTRPANLNTGDLKLPKGTTYDVTGLKPCPPATIEANDVKSCPKQSIVGTATGTILSAPVRDKPYDATGDIYFTGMSGKKANFAVFYSLVEIPSAHSITTGTVSKGKVHFEMPKIPTAPGLPDATPLHVGFKFDTKGPKGTLFRLTAACKKGTAITSGFGFYDGSKTTASGAC